MKHSVSPSSGNILVILLVAVALLSLLTMTVMRSDVTDADSVAPEQAKIIASRVMSQVRTIEEAVKAMQLRGCSEQEFSFEDATHAAYANAGAPSNKSCHLFEKEGAGLDWPVVPANANDGSEWRFLAGNAVGGLSNTDDGSCSSGCIDLMAVLPNVNVTVCQQLNALAGTTEDDDTPPQDTGDFNGTTKIAGFSGTAVGEPILDASNVLYGRNTGCFQSTAVDTTPNTNYWFYHVLVAR